MPIRCNMKAWGIPASVVFYRALVQTLSYYIENTII